MAHTKPVVQDPALDTDGKVGYRRSADLMRERMRRLAGEPGMTDAEFERETELDRAFKDADFERQVLAGIIPPTNPVAADILRRRSR